MKMKVCCFIHCCAPRSGPAVGAQVMPVRWVEEILSSFLHDVGTVVSSMTSALQKQEGSGHPATLSAVSVLWSESGGHLHFLNRCH